jgi:phosphomannomutase
MYAHHYFRDFAYCDSGMVPWLLVLELISKSGHSLSNLIQHRFEKFPSSGEINFTVADAHASIVRVSEAYKSQALSVDEMDGLSLDCGDWRFNLRKSNTEALVRLNLEARGNAGALEQKIAKLSALIVG